MKQNILFAVAFVLLLLAGCKKDDVTNPKISFTSPADGSALVAGKEISVSYTIEDENAITDHKLVVADADGKQLFSYDKDKKTGTHTQTFSVTQCNYKSPIVIRVTAKDATGNIGSQAVTLSGEELNINLALTYDGKPLEYLTNYKYPNGRKVQFTRVSMYVSGVGMDNHVSPCIHYLDFGDISGSTATAKKGLDFQVHGIPNGEYKKLVFNIGVDNARNDKNPSDFPSGHPLNAPAEYWNGWKSYVFLKLEGTIDLDDNPKDLEKAFALHIGANDDANGNPINALISVSNDTTYTITNTTRNLKLQMDVAKVFERDGKIYDIKTRPGTHAPATLPYILQLARNAEHAFSQSN